MRVKGSLRTGLVAVAAGALAMVAGCAEVGSCAQGQLATLADCAAAVRYDGSVYLAWSNKLPAVRGARLGDAVYPGCSDVGCAAASPDTPTTVWTLRGVEPDVAVVARQEGTRHFVVFAPMGTDPKDIFRFTKDGGWQLRR